MCVCVFVCVPSNVRKRRLGKYMHICYITVQVPDTADI